MSMKRFIIFIALILATVQGFASPILTEFSGQDVVTQKTVEYKFPSEAAATVVLFISAKCPCSASHEVLLKELQMQFKEFTFVGVHSNADETAEMSKAHFSENALPFPVISDQKSHLANKLGAIKTPHAFVLNKNGEIIYQGGVTDSHVGPTAKKHFLKEVLEDLHAGKTPRHKEGRALGCYIQREDE